MEELELKKLCGQMREDILRMIHAAGSGHPGGSLSEVEILATLYFGGVMRVDPNSPEWEARDRLILSKGHSAPALYSVLARKGFFPLSWLDSLRRLGSPLQGHPHAVRVPGCDCSSGSLGQGLSVSNGLAMALRRRGLDSRVYCILGDGELQEGQVWEAVMTAAHYQLNNVCAIVDYNGVQLDGRLEEVMGIGCPEEAFAAFGWHVIFCDGHDLAALGRAFDEACANVAPSVIFARTIKGKGVSFMEDRAEWHGKAPNDAQLAAALDEIRREVC